MDPDEEAEEETMSLDNVVELVDEEMQMYENAQALLGPGDDKFCTYMQGYMDRQALYSCRTCRLENVKSSGICLACSLQCHDGHDLIELYTKRNFRCDCGNSLFPAGFKCKLEPIKCELNDLNECNQNFDGLYCTCCRPYPDYEDPIDDTMIQCVICEDWLHGRHATSLDFINMDFEEMICEACLLKHPFLLNYISICNAICDIKKDKKLKQILVDSSPSNQTGLNDKQSAEPIHLISEDEIHLDFREDSILYNAKSKPNQQSNEHIPVTEIDVACCTSTLSDKQSSNIEACCQSSESSVFEERDDGELAECDKNKVKTLLTDCVGESGNASSCSNLNRMDAENLFTCISATLPAHANASDSSTGSTLSTSSHANALDGSTLPTTSRANASDGSTGSTLSASSQANVSDDSALSTSSQVNVSEDSTLPTTSQAYASDDITLSTSSQTNSSDDSTLSTSSQANVAEGSILLTTSQTYVSVNITSTSSQTNSTDDSTLSTSSQASALEGSTLPTSSQADASDGSALSTSSQANVAEGSILLTTSQADASDGSKLSTSSQANVSEDSQADVSDSSKLSTSSQANVSEDSALPTTSQANDPESSALKGCDLSTCVLNRAVEVGFNDMEGATFWPQDWREKLCSCSECLAMYERENIGFLPQFTDTLKHYESKGRSIDSLVSQHMAQMGHVQKIELVHGYMDLKNGLTDYLKKFENGKVVREEDILEFFEGLQSNKKRKIL